MYVNNKTQINPSVPLVTISPFAIVAVVVCSSKYIIGQGALGQVEIAHTKLLSVTPLVKGSLLL